MIFSIRMVSWHSAIVNSIALNNVLGINSLVKLRLHLCTSLYQTLKNVLGINSLVKLRLHLCTSLCQTLKMV